MSQVVDAWREVYGGGSGIRTHDTVARIHAFQACAFSHSAIPPQGPLRRGQGAGNIDAGTPSASGLAWAFDRCDAAIHVHGGGMLAFFRFLAAVFLLIAVLAAVYDGTRTLAADQLVTTSLLEHWSTLAPTLLNTAQGAVKRSTHPLVWDVGLGKI